jgi:hypothetical protein
MTSLSVALLASLLCVGPMIQADTLLRETFDGDPTRGHGRYWLEHPHIELVEGAGPDGSNAIRVAYVGFDRGSERVVLRAPLAGRARSARLTFDVCFDRDFQWVRAGKLHGLGPKEAVTGGNARRPWGWSARAVFSSDGRLGTYLYDQDAEKKYGVGERSAPGVLSRGSWQRIEMDLHLNTPGEADGLAILRVDGTEAVRHEGVAFRGQGGQRTLIQAFLFSTFHGGSDPSWAPRDGDGNYTTVFALFDNFEVNRIDRPE